MAGMKIALLMVFLLAVSSQPTAGMCPSCPKECCFAVRRGVLRTSSVASYYRTTSDCYLDALVFVMKSGRQICVDPQMPWVKRAVPILPEKK